MKSLVIGATGQLGSNLVRALLEHGHDVRVLVRPTSKTFTLDGLKIDRVVGDLNDHHSVSRACHGVNVVYQTAGYYPSATIPVVEAKTQALTETQNLVEAIRSSSTVERFVLASTLTTVGFPKTLGQLANEDCPFSTRFPNNPYLLAKVAMEEKVLSAALNGLPAVVVVPTVFFGPYDKRPTSGTQILMIAKRLMPAYLQGKVNAIDVRDVAIAMIRAAEYGRVGERYIVGNWNTSQRELNALIAEVAEVRKPVFPVPFAMARVGAKLGEHIFRVVLKRPPLVPAFFVEMIKHMQHYDCSKAIRELNYPRSSVEQAIRDALTWFKGK